MKSRKRLILLMVFQSVIYAQSGWTPTYISTTSDFASVIFTNDLTGFVVGSDGVVLKTTNGGINYEFLNLGVNENFNSIISFGNNKLCIVGDEITAVSTNSGNNWTINIVASIYLYSAAFSSQDIGFAVGEGSFPFGILIKTSNGGNNWSTVFTDNLIFNSIYFINPNTGFIVGGGEKIFYTTNSGNNWAYNTIPISNNHAYYVVYFTNSFTGYVMGGGPISGNQNASDMYKSTNSGSNWTSLPILPATMFDCQFIDDNLGYATGFDFSWSHIYKTTNGGLNWVSQINAPIYIKDIFFINGNTGYAVVNNTIYKTTNGGNPIGIQPISNEVPYNFSLFQNYPNPFNPNTSIKFSIPKSSFVNITIYNMLGEEVVILVNQELKPGTYEADFDGSNLPSGTYFYRLQAGNYTETKKMVLLK